VLVLESFTGLNGNGSVGEFTARSWNKRFLLFDLHGQTREFRQQTPALF